MIKKILFVYIVLSLLWQLPLSAADFTIQVINQSLNSVTLKATFSEPKLKTTENTENKTNTSFFYMEGLPLLQEEGFPVVPYLSKMVSLPGDKAVFNITHIKTQRTFFDHTILNINSAESKSLNTVVTLKNKTSVEVNYLGLFRDIPLFNLIIFPVKIDLENKQAEWIETITVEIKIPAAKDESQFVKKKISSKENALLQKLLLNDRTVDYQAASSLVQSESLTSRYRQGRYKMLIDADGLYKITYNDLVQNEIPVDTWDTRKLKISNKENEIPIYFKGGEDGRFDPGDYFEFWAIKNPSIFRSSYPDVYSDPFTDINVYWLEIAEKNGLRMVEESGSLIESVRFITPRAFTESIHFEEDNFFERFGQPSANGDQPGYTLDHWFYDSGVTAVGSRSYPAYLPWPYKDISSNLVFVKAMLRGKSYSSLANPLVNHQVELWLNNEKVGNSGEWRSQEYHIITNEGGRGLAQTSIQHGENELRMIMDQTGVTDKAMLNWFEVTYQRKYRADNNFIKFKKQENIPADYVLQFEVDGFSSSDIDLYKLGISKLVNVRIDYATATDNVSSYRISFQDEIFYSDIEYIALTQQAKKKPLQIIPDLPWIPEIENASLYDNANAAEYLIITHDLFYENVLRLKEYRQQNGLKVEVVKVEDIYDEFNFGIKSPLAIKNFLKYVYESWDQSSRLLYVLFAGNATYDYKNVRLAKQDYVPTFIFETKLYGAAASDHYYTLISGDDMLPDLIVGRIPVENNSEFEAYFDKIVGYEAPDNIGEWRNKGLFISGNDASTKEFYTNLPAFRAQNQRIINLNLPEGYLSRKLNTIEDASLPIDRNFGGTNDLINFFDDGLSMINFFGHGGGGIWADVQLFNTNDVDRLSNQYRLPFVQSMTCFTGAYESPNFNGLAERLILAPEKGAIGVIGASGVGWLHNDFALGWTLTNFLLEKNLTVGEGILFAKIFYLANNQYVTEEFDAYILDYFNLRQSMVNHYNLLGDPYISISIPPKELNLKVDNVTPSIGDTLNLILTAPFSSGSGKVELSNENHEPVSEVLIDINNFEAKALFLIPEEVDNQRLFLKAFAIDDLGNRDARGVTKLAINKAILDSVIVAPENPQVGDSIFFSVYITSPVKIESVRIDDLEDNAGHDFSVVLNKIADTLWTNTTGFTPYSNADTIFFDVTIIDTSGSRYLSRNFTLIITDPRPDVKIASNSFKFNGTTEINLSVDIINDSNLDLPEVDVVFYVDSISAEPPPFYQETLNISHNTGKTVAVNIEQYLLTEGRQFIVSADPNNKIEERIEDNNSAHMNYSGNLFTVSHELGTTVDGLNDTISLGEIGRLYLPLQSLSASSTVSYALVDIDVQSVADTQPGFEYIRFFQQSDSTMINLKYNNPAAKQLKTGFIEINIDTSIYSQGFLNKVAICEYVPKLNRWKKLTSQWMGDRLYAGFENLGNFALFLVSDDREPVIEITVNGRTLHNNMLVPENPKIGLILQDENGINLSSGFSILVDNEPVPSSEINMPDTVHNANAVSVLTTPKLSVGNHNLTVNVSDASGEAAVKSIDFSIAADFELKIYGNYPNPFEDITIMSFQIVAGAILDEFSIKIYTVSGRLIRKITQNENYPDEIWDPGYHEVEWDGRDKDGYLVANGVYFAIVKAKYRGETIEHTLKLAKLK